VPPRRRRRPAPTGKALLDDPPLRLAPPTTAPPEFEHLEPLTLPTVLTPIHKDSPQRFARYRKTAFTRRGADEVAHEPKQQSLLLHQLVTGDRSRIGALEKVVDADVECAARSDRADRPRSGWCFFVLVRLLVGDADERREPLLSETQRYPSFDCARANVTAERFHTTTTGTGRRFVTSFR
jgi:hypothetical protein